MILKKENEPEEIRIRIPDTYEGYQEFLRCKQLPNYQVRGRMIITDSLSYASIFGGKIGSTSVIHSPHLLDFQKELTKKALTARRYALFLDCGLGKTAIELAFAYSIAKKGKVLILTPLAVLEQFQRESKRWYGRRLANLRNGDEWKDVAICNFEYKRRFNLRNVAGIILDESSILKNDTGELRTWLTEMASTIEYRLCASATPAPNDHTEYATHSVFLGYSSTAKEFYARYFRKNHKGTGWLLSPYAVDRFYSDISTWAAFIQRPSLLGYSAKTEMKEEPDYDYQRYTLSSYKDENKKGGFFNFGVDFKDLKWVMSDMRCDEKSKRTKGVLNFVKNKRSIIWCARNNEEKMYNRLVSNSVLITGATPIEKRIEYIDDWKAGKYSCLISKPRILGFGVNLPECEVMAFPGFTHSFEQFYQAIRRGHRYGREGRLKVLIPYTYPESRMLSNLRRKIETFEHDMSIIQNKFYER